MPGHDGGEHHQTVIQSTTIFSAEDHLLIQENILFVTYFLNDFMTMTGWNRWYIVISSSDISDLFCFFYFCLVVSSMLLFAWFGSPQQRRLLKLSCGWPSIYATES